MMSSPRLTDGAGGSHLPAIVRRNDGVWSEVSLNLNESSGWRAVERETSVGADGVPPSLF